MEAVRVAFISTSWIKSGADLEFGSGGVLSQTFTTNHATLTNACSSEFMPAVH